MRASNKMQLATRFLLLAALAFSLAAAPTLAQEAQAEKPKGTGVVPAGVKLAPQMPAGASSKAYPFPKPVTRTLPNGLRVFVVADAEVPSVSVRLVLTSAGTIHDPDGKAGVASMTAAMLTQGTATRTAQQIAEAIDFVGGSLSASASSDASFVTATVVKKDLALAMDLVADVTRNAAFAEQELERQRQQLLGNLQVQYSDPNYLASAVFSRVVYGDHPYGLPGEGTPASARAITRDDLAAFRDAHYAPNTTLLAFAGDITPEAAFAAAEKYFGDWAHRDAETSSANAKQAPSGEAAAAQRAAGLRIFVVDKPDAVQTQIRVGRPSIRRSHPDYIPFVVANHILGGGFNSRLSTEVRIRKGLTYGAYSRLDTRRAAGSFFATTFTRSDATVEATRLVVNLLQQMAQSGASADDLSFATDFLAGVFPIQTETAEQIANQILLVEQYGLPADYNDTYRERIRGVSTEQVKAMAAKYLVTSDLDIVLAGNAGAFRDALKKEFPNAKWEEIPFADVDLLAADLRRAEEKAAAASPESLSRGKAVLMAAVEAAGGQALAKVSSVQYTGSGQLITPQGNLPLEIKSTVSYPNRFRLEISSPMFGAISQGFDGTDAWLLGPQGLVDFPAEFRAEQERRVTMSASWGVLQMALAGTLEASLVGEEEVDGKKVVAVEWESRAGRVRLFVDTATRLLVGARYRETTQAGAFDSLIVWSDFRDVNGLKFPYQSTVYREGQKFTEQTIKEVTLNPAVEASAFARPKQ